MIIECPSCQARYRIREEKLPADGGGIKCPNCAHVFAVTPDGHVAEMQKPAPPHGTQYNQAVRKAEEEIEQARSQLDAASAPPPPSDTASKRAVSRWKVRNAGLVFDFADIDSVKRWLANRDSLDSVEASDDLGQSWAPVNSFDELTDLRNARKPPITLSGTSREAPLDPPASRGRTVPPGSQLPPSPDEIRAEAEARLREARTARGATESPPVVTSKRDAKQEAPKDEKPKKFERLIPVSEKQQARIASGSKVLAAISLIILPLLLAVGLHATGTADLSSLLPFLPARSASSKKLRFDNGLVVDGAPSAATAKPAPAPSLSVKQAPTPPATREPGQPDSTGGSAVIVAQAREAISRGDSAEATKLLEQANQLSRGDKQVACLLAGLLSETGDKVRAVAFAEKCKEFGGTPERVSLPTTQQGASQPSTETQPQGHTGLPAAPEPAQPTIRRRVRQATGDGP